MKGKIVQFRRSRHRVRERHYLIDVSAKNREEANKFKDKEVEWKSSAGKIIKGKISGAHGGHGLARTRFERGLPGQAIMNNDEVEIR